ncbi:hypothetical protein MACK_000833 [Theileria orientalis]|uniref:Uncharacterized protein n=1 Tax=Theileria orientalis TaxID=68886 RepID=A0A976QUP0_THEOR|nr:hypothetical protein MACK_000833 [Theileria orientalis]
MGKAAGNLVMSKIRVKNTFMNLPEDQEYTGTAIYKSLSMPTLEDNFNQWYIYNLPCFEEREHCKQLMFNSENDNSGLHFMLKPASMFKYNQECAHSDATHSNECIPLDENGKLTSIGSVRHLIGDCKHQINSLFSLRIQQTPYEDVYEWDSLQLLSSEPLNRLNSISP